MNTASQNELWSIDRLKPYANNARTHSREQIAQIAASIEEFGMVGAVVVRDGVLAKGHGTTEAVRSIYARGERVYPAPGRLDGAEPYPDGTIPVLDVSGWSDERFRAYVLADSKLALNAGWDETLLAAELADLRGAGFDLDVIGFSADELADLLDVDVEQDDGPQADDDAVPDEPVRPVSRRGDVWILGRHRLKCGDSTVLADVEDAVGGVGVECMWTDPPYNVAYEGKAGSIKNDDMEDGAFRQFLLDAFTCAFAVLKPGGAAYVAHADTEGYNFRGAFRDAGFKLSGCLIWRKNSLVLGRSDYQWQHEPILYGWKEGAAHRWYGERNKTTISEFEGQAFEQIGDRAWQIRIGEQTLIVEGDGVTVRDARPTVLTEEKPKKNGEHPTMKPVALIERYLLNSTKTGDVVLDLFGGSGSTLIACEKLGRAARLVELDEKFADVIVRRWQEYTGKEAALEDTGETFAQLQEARVGLNGGGE